MKNNSKYLCSALATVLLSGSGFAMAGDFSSSITIQENQSGFCSADGDASEASNSGYTGAGYVNVINESETAVNWKVETGQSGSYTVSVRYANGSGDARPATIYVNGTKYTLKQASTGSWSNWKTESVTVYLPEGVSAIRMEADTSAGLANVDYLNVAGSAVKAASCSGTSATDVVSTDSIAAKAVGTSCSGTTSGLSASKIYYVSPNGSSGNSGSSFSSAMNFTKAMSVAKAGQMILLKPGTYKISYKSGKKNTINFAKSGSKGKPIYVAAANCGRATFDFSFPEGKWVQNSFGFYVTGDYWYFKGIDVIHAGYHGAYITGAHNTFENMRFHHNRNTGFEINKGGSYTTVINSDAYRNYDPKKHGSMADGFGPKQKQGPGNRFIGCRAWENSDDGFDLYDSPQKVIIEDSWAFRNGIDYWNDSGFKGNGNGFKLGGKRAVGNHRITRSVAFGNVNKGFDQNNNAGGVTVINNTSYKNGTNYGFGNSLASGQKHYFRNNVSLSGSVSVKNASAKHNSWDTGPSASKSDFVSLDTSKATVSRNKDGSLPSTSLFRLSPKSQLINAGSKESGISYKGSAPDLGAFERK
ncbi:right-handed parallel beta-helix repeat-containing protein [Vibrio quintilis]|uniref:Pectate lyase L n=1 Tax=Vibrio quintilis TaxID=1117707 RepID=A0A1M7YXW9_9VIBR|nr:right-handed parallel beta-helix repeat-containing protein [Vibrio quintilis]SHO57393.1 Pectate lyase L precursor [Vibrio quintilis]